MRKGACERARERAGCVAASRSRPTVWLDTGPRAERSARSTRPADRADRQPTSVRTRVGRSDSSARGSAAAARRANSCACDAGNEASERAPADLAWLSSERARAAQGHLSGRTDRRHEQRAVRRHHCARRLHHPVRLSVRAANKGGQVAQHLATRRSVEQRQHRKNLRAYLQGPLAVRTQQGGDRASATCLLTREPGEQRTRGGGPRARVLEQAGSTTKRLVEGTFEFVQIHGAGAAGYYREKRR